MKNLELEALNNRILEASVTAPGRIAIRNFLKSLGCFYEGGHWKTYSGNMGGRSIGKTAGEAVIELATNNFGNDLSVFAANFLRSYGFTTEKTLNELQLIKLERKIRQVTNEYLQALGCAPDFMDVDTDKEFDPEAGQFRVIITINKPAESL
jgi:hypothetical protein